MGSFKKYNLNKFDGVTHTVDYTFPGVGKTGDVIHIRSRYSSEYREAEAKANRQISSMIIANQGKEIEPSLLDNIDDRKFAALIAGWSFDEECNVDNIIEFFKANPHTYDEINRLAAQDTLFFDVNAKN